MDRGEMLVKLTDISPSSAFGENALSTKNDYVLFALIEEDWAGMRGKSFHDHLGFVPDAVMLVHPRNLEDVYQRCGYLRDFDTKERTDFLENLWPLVLDKATYNGKNILVLTLPLLPEYWFPVIDDREKHRHFKEVREARWNDILTILKYMEEKIGPYPIILGALTGRMSKFLTKSGIKSPLISGIHLTPHIIEQMIDDIAEMTGESPSDYHIAIVGGAGQMGRSILDWIVGMEEYGEITVIETDEKRLDGIRDIAYEGSKVTLSTDIRDIRDADILIVATAAAGAIIDQSILSPGTIVIDDTHPSNIAQNIPRSRNLVLRVMAKVPGLDYHFPMDQFGPEESVTCFAEGCIIAHDIDTFKRYTEPIDENGEDIIVGKESFATLAVGNMADELGIVNTTFRDKHGIVTDDEIIKMRVIKQNVASDWSKTF